MRSYMPEISGAIKEREIALFCGAGISKNSGLPLANELKQYILEKLPFNQKDVDEVMNSVLPFEAFMQSVLFANASNTKFLNMFADGRPNTNHVLIARLAKNGHLKTIFTTNFDLLIEKALESEGLKENVDYQRYYDEEHFSRVDLNKLSDKIAIIKIHGSIDDITTIRMTLQAVASKTLADTRWEIVRYLFSTGRHKKVLILGYSSSDEFDITPQIQSVQDNRKEIVFVEHCKEEKIEDVSEKDFKNPFKEFPGSRIKCDTDKFIKELWDSLKVIVEEECELTKSRVGWRLYVDDWARELEKYNGFDKYFTAASILSSTSNKKRRIEFNEKALEAAKAIGDSLRESSCYKYLGGAYYGLGDFKKALEYHKMGLKITSRSEESSYYECLARDFRGLGDLKKTIECYKKALKINKTPRNWWIEMRCYLGLGAAQHSLGNFRDAIDYHKKAVEIARSLGNKSEESNCYSCLGATYRSLGEYNRAIEYHKRALEISIAIGDRDGESRSYIGLGADHYELGDLDKAIKYQSTALEINKKKGNNAGESDCYIDLGNTYQSLRKYNMAIEYHKRALEISIAIGSRDRESTCYSGLGNDFYCLRDFKRAIKYHIMALEIIKEIGDKSIESICYLNLGGAYCGLGDFKKAIKLYLKAEKIFREKRQTHYLKMIYYNLCVSYIDIGDYETAEEYRKLAN